MSSLSLGPNSVDLTLYYGDTFNIDFTVLNGDGSPFSKSGSWQMKFYDKKQWSTPLNVGAIGGTATFFPSTNISASYGLTGLTINGKTSQSLALASSLSASGVVYELSLEHAGRDEKFTILNGDVEIIIRENI
jgi:hypothetical protein